MEEAHLDGRVAEPRYIEGDIIEAQQIANGSRRQARPWESRIKATQQHVRDRYLVIADGLDQLGGHEDRKLAEQVRRFVADMPAPLTRRERLVEDVKAIEMVRSVRLTNERENDVLER